MTKKRYKKLLMSTGIQRNMAELLTVYGRHRNIQIDRRALHLDVFRLGFHYTARPFAESLYAIRALSAAIFMKAAMNVLDASNFELKQFFEGGDSDA